MFTGMTVMVKLLGDRLDAMQISFFRMLVSLIVILPFLYRAGLSGAGGIKTQVPLLQVARGVIGSSAMMLGFYAIVHLPLADVQALSFSRTLFLVPLAVIILGETVGWNRGLAVLCGFGGVLIMLRPGSEGFEINLAIFAVLGHALFVALASILVRIVSQYDTPTTMMFYSNIFGILLASIPAYIYWIPPTAEEYMLLFVMGVLGALAHNCFIRAYGMGEASAIAPVDYTRLVFAAIAGYVLFGDIPDNYKIIGALVIVATTLYIIRREAALGKTTIPS